MKPKVIIGEIFDSTHVKESSEADPPATCVDFAHTGIGPFRVSEEENRVLEISSKALIYNIHSPDQHRPGSSEYPHLRSSEHQRL